ncbi:hypothetical protein M8332_06850 (plasmid) [Fructilactobacillus ixorae]|uniref:Head decoration protein n=1 Tax=Fructilactobacillus ixorae TaxID=1750535 RepID=A0ABY5C9G2_9LACO|nr:hypothetical protein [Fructilactobacillus ixorae]USS94000.1 hypothetical protein M8332_06850 [Fructilactobacillus ixorae]
MEKKEFYTPNAVVVFPEKATALGGIISSDLGVTENGRKIVKAGTPVGGDDFTVKDQTVLGAATADNVQGVLYNDVDVTNGNGNGTVMVSGYINERYLDSRVNVSDDIKKALKNKITFINR